MGLTNGLQMLVFGEVQKLKVENNYSKGHKKIGLNERYVSKIQSREQGHSWFKELGINRDFRYSNLNSITISD